MGAYQRGCTTSNMFNMCDTCNMSLLTSVFSELFGRKCKVEDTCHGLALGDAMSPGKVIEPRAIVCRSPDVKVRVEG